MGRKQKSKTGHLFTGQWEGHLVRRALFLLHASMALSLSLSPLEETKGDLKPSISNSNTNLGCLKGLLISGHLNLGLF